jgi:Tfp pilus assembly protein PilZ
VPIDLEVWITRGPDARVALCTSLSLGGMFVETDLRFEYESPVDIDLPILEQAHVLRLNAIVRWFDARGVGVQFLPMGARETHALSALIEAARRAAGGPSAVASQATR